MRFYLIFEPEGVLTLPLAHHHILQGFIYSVISSNKNYSQFLHEQGYRTSGSSFKLFTFGPLNGTYHVNRQRKEIRFLVRLLLKFAVQTFVSAKLSLMAYILILFFILEAPIFILQI